MCRLSHSTLAYIAILTACVVSASPARADGVWLSLATGAAGASTPSTTNEYWFDTPHAPPLIGVNQLAGGLTAEAGTGGGNVFFGGLGAPVLLNLADGAAYVASGGYPESAKYAGAAGSGRSTPSSAAPVAGGPLPSNAALLGVTLADPDTAGTRTLTAAVTDANGNPLVTGTAGVPDGGWWVIGLTPGAKDLGGGGVDPGPVDPGPVDPGPVDPGPVDPNPPGNPDPGTPAPGNSDGGSIATPEPSTIVMACVGGLVLKLRRRAKAWAK